MELVQCPGFNVTPCKIGLDLTLSSVAQCKDRDKDIGLTGANWIGVPWIIGWYIKLKHVGILYAMLACCIMYPISAQSLIMLRNGLDSVLNSILLVYTSLWIPYSRLSTSIPTLQPQWVGVYPTTTSANSTNVIVCLGYIHGMRAFEVIERFGSCWETKACTCIFIPHFLVISPYTLRPTVTHSMDAPWPHTSQRANKAIVFTSCSSIITHVVLLFMFSLLASSSFSV